MDYADASFFNGAHFAHITAWQEHDRTKALHRHRLAQLGKKSRPSRSSSGF